MTRPVTASPAEPAGRFADTQELPTFAVAGVRAYSLPVFVDARGALAIAEYDTHLPFVPYRYFVMLDVPAGQLRGDHAHRECHQFVVCLRGRCTLGLDDGQARDAVVLESPAIGVHVPPRTWCTVRLDTSDTVLLVLASEAYRADDYIHDYEEFLRQVSAS